MSISIILPAFNEEKGIGHTLDELKATLAKNHYTYEIIVINDASTDETANIAAKRAGVCVIPHDQNYGYGASIKTGVKRATYDTILIMDADGTYPPNEVPKLLAEVSSYDMIIGARTGEYVKIPLIRRPAKWFLTKLANYLSESKIVDLNSGLRIFKKEFFNKYLKILPNGFSLTTTITIAAHSNHQNIKYIPINYYPRKGTSKIKPFRDTLNFCLLIIRTILLFNPLKIFFLISIFMCTTALLIFFYSLFFLPYTLDITSVVLLIGGIQIFATGMIADLINRRMS